VDGFKREVTDSLQGRLSLWLSLVILCVALAAGAFSFVAAFDEAHELQDDVLRQVASLFDRSHTPLPHSDDSGRLADSDEESRVIVQFFPSQSAGNEISSAGAPLTLSASLRDGIQTFTSGGEQYRLFVKTLASGKRLAVAQETGLRDETARESALRAVMPFLILVPILLLVVADLIRRMFAPIAALSAEIDQRGERDLHPFTPEPLPAEIRPFVTAINRLLRRVSQSMDAQRRFVADAAHELRSPTTALSLQAERLAEAEMSDAAQERLAVLRKGIERGRMLLDQLLALARAQSDVVAPDCAISIQDVFRSALESVMPLAEAKEIDIGVDSEGDPEIPANEHDLFVIVKNLVENAIRYSPRGSRVDLSVHETGRHVVLQVSDSGPGIPPEERQRVFDAFYRIPGSEESGSGLGLSIVRATADRVGADISLGYTNETDHAGLTVKVAMVRLA
jgi:two-component system OmpR family sensor kinase